DNSLKWKSDFGLIEYMKQDDVVPRVTETADSVENGSGVGQKVGENHHHGAVADHRGDAVQVGADIGHAGRFRAGEQGEQVAELGALAASGERIADFFVEGDDSDRVLLLDHQVRDRRGEANGVFELVECLAVGVA